MCCFQQKGFMVCIYYTYIYIYMYVYITIHQNTYIGRRWGNINKFAGVELDCVKFSRHPVDIVVSHVDIGSRYPKWLYRSLFSCRLNHVKCQSFAAHIMWDSCFLLVYVGWISRCIRWSDSNFGHLGTMFPPFCLLDCIYFQISNIILSQVRLVST